MISKKTISPAMVLLLLAIGSAGCFLQPKAEIVREYNFIDMDAPAVRLARPVTAELLMKTEEGKWVPAGKGLIPAGAYVKGRAPKGIVEGE